MKPADAGPELLALSGLLDAPLYRGKANLSEAEDPAGHYLEQGWRDGLDPSDAFDGAFLHPFYAASGFAGPPALTWLELSVKPGRRPPMNRTEAHYVADRVRNSPFFDAEAYARRLPPGLDPLLHYTVIGEQLGWRPSAALDPAFYLERHPDVARLDLSPLDHYVEMGAREGRRAVPATDRLTFPALPDPARHTVLVISHEASRTGAPVLGLNVAGLLGRSCNVVAILLRGGALEPLIREATAATVGPMAPEEWHPSEMRRLAERLVEAYRPVYAIANSAETHMLIPALARRGVPVVALVHEFAAYLRPLSKLVDVLSWAAHIVVPAKLVAASAERAIPAIGRRRGLHILAQGLPKHRAAPRQAYEADPDVFVVLGLGTVHLRKGVDLFIAAAAAAIRLAPERRFRFIWVGGGFDPDDDVSYSVYLDAQIVQSGLEGVLEMHDEVEDLDPFYACADLFLLASRLDPQPNVAIDAMLRGIPTICFAGASGTAEILGADPHTAGLVAPHLDAHAAAAIICRLAADRPALAAMGQAVARVGHAAYDLDAYVDQLDRWGQAAASSLHAEDLRTLAESGAIDPDLALPPGAHSGDPLGPERHVLQQWAVVGLSPDQDVNGQFRRPCAGFHPQAYAHAHAEACGEGGANPVAHWLRAGRPQGAWLHPVFSPGPEARPRPPLAVALFAHLDRMASAEDLLSRLRRNDCAPDLFLSATDGTQLERLRDCFAAYKGKLAVESKFTLAALDADDYDMVGQLQDAPPDGQRNFLWDNLVGDLFPMLDEAAAALAEHPHIGLLMAEDPHLPGWNGTRALVTATAAALGLPPPDAFAEFPAAGMFWARPAALRPLRRLNRLDPPTPGVLERLLPLATRSAGLGVGGLRAPGTSW